LWEVPLDTDGTTLNEYYDGFYGAEQQYYIKFGPLLNNVNLATAGGASSGGLTGGSLSAFVGGSQEYTSGLRVFTSASQFAALVRSTFTGVISTTLNGYPILHGWVTYTKT